jgi:hypothetical protein
VIDLGRTELGAIGIAQAVHALRPDLPILAITAFAQSGALQRLPVGATVLRRPFRQEELVRRLEAAIGPSIARTEGPPRQASPNDPISWSVTA